MRAILVVTWLVAAALPVAAQEKGKLGLDAAFNGGGNIGLTWHATKRLALRPFLGFSHESFRTDQADVLQGFPERKHSSDRSGTRLAAGVAALFYLPKTDGLAPYVGLSYERFHSSFSGTGGGVFTGFFLGEEAPDRTPTTEETGNGNHAQAFFGLQHGFGTRFGLFGEVGASYSSSDMRSTTDSTVPRYDPVRRQYVEVPLRSTWRARPKSIGSFSAQVGAIFYFN